MATMNISLPDQMRAWVEDRSASGRYSNSSDYVRHLIRRDQERQMAVDTLQAAITEGIESGDPQPFDLEAFKLEMRQQHVVK